MSSSVGNKPPTSPPSYDKVEIDLANADTASDSLYAAHEKFQGKVLFYKKGKKIYAVAEKNRPIFFWKQLFSLGCWNKAHYANDEVGGKLADLFRDEGKSLKEKMNTGWMIKTKQAVDSKEFVDAIHDSLDSDMKALRLRIENTRNPRNGPASDVASTCEGCLTQLSALQSDFGAYTRLHEVYGQLRNSLAHIQFNYLSALYDSHVDRSVKVKNSIATDVAHDEFLESMKGHVSDQGFAKIEQAGLANESTLRICKHWEGNLEDFANVLLSKAGELNRRCTSIFARIEKLSKQPESTFDANKNANKWCEPLEYDALQPNGDLGYLDYRIHDIDELTTYSEKVAELDAIEKKLTDYEQTSSANQLASGGAQAGPLGVHEFEEHLQKYDFVNSEKQACQARISQQISGDLSVFAETLKQTGQSMNTLKALRSGLHDLAEEILARRPDANGEYEIAGAALSRQQLEHLRDGILTRGEQDHGKPDPMIGPLLSRYCQMPVTIYQYDQKTGHVAEHNFGSEFMPANRIELAMRGWQFYGVQLQPFPPVADNAPSAVHDQPAEQENL